jgi:tRNA G18 (ribose-2'-O)-methylase SpoU
MAKTRTRRVDRLEDPCLDPYRGLVKRSRSGASAHVIVEGRIAVQRALDCGWRPRSVVGTASMLAALDPSIPPHADRIQLEASELRDVVGFDFHRGCMAAFDRPATLRQPPAQWVDRMRERGCSTVIVAHALADPTNLGAIARTARALGVDLLVADAHAADPYERRAIRASMGHVLCLPLVCSPDLHETIDLLRRALNPRVLAATTGSDARPLCPGRPADHLVVMVGHEGEGLPSELRELADEEITIGMTEGVDSLNVATALGIILWAMR